MVGKSDFKENPKSNHDLDLGVVNNPNLGLDLGFVNFLPKMILVSKIVLVKEPDGPRKQFIGH